MAKLVYVDTNIFIDFIAGRDERSYDFFKRTTDCKYSLVISSLTVKELVKNTEVTFLFEMLKQMNKLKIVEINSLDIDKAKEDLQTHLADAIHIVICKKINADFLLTKNTKDFEHFPLTRSYDTI